MADRRTGSGRGVAGRRLGAPFRVRRRDGLMAKMETGGHAARVQPKLLQQLLGVFLSPDQVTPRVGTPWKSATCHSLLGRFERELPAGLGCCDRTKGWVGILLYLENMNLVKALGSGLGYGSGKLALRHLLPVEAQLAEPVEGADVHEATLIKLLQHVPGVDFYRHQSHNFKAHNLGQVPPDGFRVLIQY